MKRNFKIKRSTINHAAKLGKFTKAPIRSFIAIFMLGASLGVLFEETVGIGTWHNFNPATEKLNICFTPPSGCGSLIAQELVKATKTIHLQAYGLTLPSIIYQLKAARQRGVQVFVLLDGGNLSDNLSIYHELKQAGIEVAFDKMPGIAHNKVIIIDQNKLITGSFNFTKSADHKNAENVLLIQDPAVASSYLRNWQSRWQNRVNPPK